MKINNELLNTCLDKIISKRYIYSAVLKVESGDSSFSWMGARGEMESDSKYFIASVTKLYITAVVMHLVEEHNVSLDDKITKYLPNNVIENLHVLDGVDHSKEITIKHLITNTSGIPDYFFYKEKGKSSAASSLLQGNDESWGFDRTIQSVKMMKPKFAPGRKGKASYSDTNYQLLGKIIEAITGNSIHHVFRTFIFDKLNLNNTYTYEDIEDNNPVAFYHKEKRLWLPNYMASVTPEGGIISTADDVMIFLKAFFHGFFFSRSKIDGLKKWNYILPPPGFFGYGIGLEKIPTPRLLNPIKPINEILGFWGQTGSLAWYNPDTDLYFTGTTNQTNGTGHMVIGNVMLKIIKSAL